MVGIGSEVKGHVKREQMGAAARRGGKMNDRLGDGEMRRRDGGGVEGSEKWWDGGGGGRKGEKEWVRVGLYYSITEGGLILSYLEPPSTPYMLIALTS